MAMNVFLQPFTLNQKQADWYIGDLNQACLEEQKVCIEDKNKLFAEYQACLDKEKAQTEPTFFPIPGMFYNINIFPKLDFP